MSSQRRKEERTVEEMERFNREEAERIEREKRSLYEKIEDIDSWRDVREVLHFLVDELDQSLASRGGFPRPER